MTTKRPTLRDSEIQRLRQTESQTVGRRTTVTVGSTTPAQSLTDRRGEI